MCIFVLLLTQASNVKTWIQSEGGVIKELRGEKATIMYIDASGFMV